MHHTQMIASLQQGGRPGGAHFCTVAWQRAPGQSARGGGLTPGAAGGWHLTEGMPSCKKTRNNFTIWAETHRTITSGGACTTWSKPVFTYVMWEGAD
jgi:hypothetical protein